MVYIYIYIDHTDQYSLSTIGMVDANDWFLQVLPADAVVVGAGVLPNTRFVEGLSLESWTMATLW